MAKNFSTIEECKEWLQTLPMNVLIETAAGAIFNAQKPGKIIITEEQLRTYFKIRGYNERGEVENRGRRYEYEDKNIFNSEQ